MLMQLRNHHLTSESSVRLLLTLMVLYVYGLCHLSTPFVNICAVSNVIRMGHFHSFADVANNLKICFIAVNSTVYSIFPIRIAVFALIGAAVWWVPLRSLVSRGSR